MAASGWRSKCAAFSTPFARAQGVPPAAEEINKPRVPIAADYTIPPERRTPTATERRLNSRLPPSRPRSRTSGTKRERDSFLFGVFLVVELETCCRLGDESTTPVRSPLPD